MSSTYLIFSTKGLYKSKTILLFILPAILFLFFCVLVSFGYILFVLMLTILTVLFWNELGMKKSFVELYDDKVIGMTVKKTLVKKGVTGGVTFDITYQEIQNVSYQKNVVLIQTSNQIYEVQAKGCEPKVIEIIRQQKQGTP